MMKKTNKEQPSWKEIFHLNFRAYKILYQNEPKYIQARIANTVWRALTPYVGIYLSARIINELAGARDVRLLQQLVLIALVAAALISLGNAILSNRCSVFGSNMYYKNKRIPTKKLFDMDFEAVENTKTHELRAKIDQFQNNGGWGLPRVSSNFDTAISAVFTLLGGIALTVTLITLPVPETAGAYTILNHPLLILGLIAVMLAVTCVAPLLKTKAKSFWATNNDQLSLANRLLGFFDFDMIEKKYASDSRIYQQDRIAEKYTNGKDNYFGSSGVFSKLARGPMGLYQGASSAVSVVFTGIAYAFVCLKAWAGAFGVGQITQYVASITKVASGVSSLLETLGEMRNNAPFLKTEFEFLDIPNNMYQGSLTVEKRRDRNYEIEFRNVSFKYPGAENYALRNVNMKFRVGQRLAVVGMNGSGKTTFIKLLCRLYDPTEGEILLNGINIRKYNYLDYLSIFSVVFQDFKLFAFELSENVAGSTTYDEARVRDCLIKAGFGDRLKALPKGIHTYLYKNFDKEGVDISGGEAQKIALARTLYKDAPFIILDEPTAALDPVAEAEVYSKFNEIVGDKTAIYISHRLSSCRFCDEIVVFDHGAVVQQGSHDVLVADESGKYHELWYAQAQYYV